MRQHIINLPRANLAPVQVVLGFHPRLRTYWGMAYLGSQEDAQSPCFEEHSGGDLRPITAKLQQQFGVNVPEAVCDLVREDAAASATATLPEMACLYECDPGGQVIRRHAWRTQ